MTPPKHGSWLNVVECELGVLARECLDRRIPDLDALKNEGPRGRGTGTRLWRGWIGGSPPPTLG